MKKVLLFALSTSLVLFACAPAEEAEDAAPAADVVVDEAAAVRPLAESWDPLNNAEDLEGMLGLFTDDAIRLNSGESALVGTAAIRADFTAAWDAADVVESSSVDEVQVVGDWAFARGPYISQTTSDSGDITEEIGKWVSVFHKTADGWKYYIDSWNRDAPTSAAATDELTERGELPPEFTPSGAAQEAIFAVGPAWDEANNAEDVDGLLALYTADAIRMSADLPQIQGTDALRADFEMAFAASTPNGAGVMRGMEVEGDWAYSWGTWSDSATNKETGEVRDEVGKWINVLRSTPEGWKIYVDLWNRDAPAAE